ncbi:CoA-binding protein [Thamnidium elegans]|uniref:CoA-binding domain-containing protein n=1 Tax=Thamnidium elegans TaxID=101142 RepID=A0A8H7SWS2_9FUNG|nr:hypothetical protein INT48_003247 [Thamnidium elegans]KAI8080473.1 CoA-binding protein [Thamnidium elegans]
MNNIAKNFITTPYFAVVGASIAREKFGNRVLRWFQSNGLDVTPVNPKEEIIETIATVKSIDELPNPAKTALSIITPPKITLKVLENAKNIGIKNIWIQPGAEDEAVIQFVNNNKSSLSVIFGGPCILVDGPSLLQNYRREEGHL